MMHRIASLQMLPPGKGVAVNTAGIDIAIFRIEDAVYAIENVCPHQHVPVLAEGSLEGTVLTCPMHGWRYDVSSGACVHASGRVKTYPVEIRGEDVYVDIDEDEREPWW